MDKDIIRALIYRRAYSVDSQSVKILKDRLENVVEDIEAYIKQRLEQNNG